jgi:hypothetical protein
VESIFKNLPKPLKWQSFLLHDLILLTDIPLNVQKASVKHDLNKAQTKALAKLEQASDKVFHETGISMMWITGSAIPGPEESRPS